MGFYEPWLTGYRSQAHLPDTLNQAHLFLLVLTVVSSGGWGLVSEKNRNLILRSEGGQQREEPSDKRDSRLSEGGREDVTLTVRCSFPQCSASRKKTPSMCVLVSLFLFWFVWGPFPVRQQNLRQGTRYASMPLTLP